MIQHLYIFYNVSISTSDCFFKIFYTGLFHYYYMLQLGKLYVENSKIERSIKIKKIILEK